jgi:hypothetical protein
MSKVTERFARGKADELRRLGYEGLRRRYGTERVLTTETDADGNIYEVQIDVSENPDATIGVVVTVDDVTTNHSDPAWQHFTLTPDDAGRRDSN